MDIIEAPRCLESITVYTGWVVDSIAFSYIDYTGQKRSAGRWGGPGGDPHTVSVDHVHRRRSRLLDRFVMKETSIYDE